MHTSNISDILENLSPTDVGKFLIGQGYRRDGGAPGRSELYADSNDNIILVPLKRDAKDYARRVRDIAELFIDSRTSLDDIIGKIVLPDSDIFRYRIETPDSAWGHIRLQYSHHAMHAIFDLLQYSAAGVSSKRTDYRRVSESAKMYVNQCRFGQTEYGSFILKVFCPINPIGAQDDVGEPFGRTSTKAVMENLEFLSSDRSEDPTEPLPPTLNRQVASAVTRLKPQGDLGVETEVEVRYSRLEHDNQDGLLAPSVDNDSHNLNLSQFVFSRAQSVRDRLKKSEEFESELLRGYIETLHKDRPLRDSEQSHEVTLAVKYGTSHRQLRVRLLPNQYRDAINWHDSNTPVNIEAIIDKRGKVWSVYSLKHFQSAESKNKPPSLFD